MNTLPREALNSKSSEASSASTARAWPVATCVHIKGDLTLACKLKLQLLGF